MPKIVITVQAQDGFCQLFRAGLDEYFDSNTFEESNYPEQCNTCQKACSA